MHPFQLRFHWPLLQHSGDLFYQLLTDLAALESPEYHCISRQYNLLQCRYPKAQHVTMLYYSFYFKKLTDYTFVHSTNRTFSCNCDHLITKIKSEKKKCEALFREISLGEYVNSSVKTQKVTQKQSKSNDATMEDRTFRIQKQERQVETYLLLTATKALRHGRHRRRGSLLSTIIIFHFLVIIFGMPRQAKLVRYQIGCTSE